MAAEGPPQVVVVLGLAFKPEKDNMHNAPFLVVAPRLVEAAGKLRAFDRAAMGHARALFPRDVRCGINAMEEAAGADELVLITAWNEFRALAPDQLRAVMRGDLMTDLDTAFDAEAGRAADFRDQGIGRR